MKIDLGHIVIAAIGAAFILGLAWFANASQSGQLFAVVTLAAGSWLSVVAGLLKTSPRDTGAIDGGSVKEIVDEIRRNAPTDPPAAKKDPPS